MAIFVNRESRTDSAFPLTAMAILRGAMPPFAGWIAPTARLPPPGRARFRASAT
jgi:hypothetical protein